MKIISAANSFIPRTDRIPAEATHELSTKFPAQFAEILIKKLEKLKRDQDNEEKLKKIQSEDSQSMVSQGSNRSLAEILKKNLLVSDDFDQDQSILDDHVSRVWTDKTPLRSPGDPSGRPRSPGYNRRVIFLFCYCTSDLCYILYVTFHCEIRTY